MIIKNYKQFILENNKENYEYGCLMLEIDEPNWENIISKINKDDLSDKEKGLEDYPHITLLYGLHSNEINDEDVIEFFNNIDPIDIEVSSISVFENDDFDVVKYEVIPTQELVHINNRIKEEFPYTSDFPDYKPHITIAYLKPGMGKKYKKDFESPVLLSSLDEVIYSKPNGEKVKINLNFE